MLMSSNKNTNKHTWRINGGSNSEEQIADFFVVQCKDVKIKGNVLYIMAAAFQL